MWDQTSKGKGSGSWANSDSFGYGRQLGQNEMTSLMKCHAQGEDVDEASLYQRLHGDLGMLGARASHAAAVTGLFAGRVSLLPHVVGPNAAVTTMNDAASTAPVVAVQLPAEQTDLRSGRWLAVNALDAIHYLIDIARRMAPGSNSTSNAISGNDPCAVPAQPKLVVNLSYGAMAGPHDGSGMLEAAIDELCDASCGQLAVVLAAGNAYGVERDPEAPLSDSRLPSGFHAKTVLTRGEKRHMTLFVPPDKASETYVELWFTPRTDSENKPGDELLRPVDGAEGQLAELTIKITPSDGIAWGALPYPGYKLMPENPTNADQIEAGLFFFRKVGQSAKRSMALLVVAPTQMSGTDAAAPAGRWKIEFESDTDRDIEIDAWVERDDTTEGAIRPQSARMVENDDGSFSGLTDSNTFSNIATGMKSFRVGALVDRGEGLRSKEVSPYSSAAVDDASGPEFSSIADDNPVLPGIRVDGSHSGMVVRGSGTSVAAPQAARWIANEMERGQKLRDIRAGLPNEGNARLGKKRV